MFKLIGAVLAVYVCYAVVTGRVMAKAGAGSREVLRDESPGYFWVVIAIYAGLSLALFTMFWGGRHHGQTQPLGGQLGNVHGEVSPDQRGPGDRARSQATPALP
jgi:drug/metabolite transporter (DMT)-like permease